MGSPRKQSLLGELDRAPAARQSRIGLRRICFGELTLAMPPAIGAAFGGIGGHRPTERVREL